MNKLKWVILLVFLGICGTVNSQDLSALDENNGFQNYKFGMHMDEFQNCDFETVENAGAEKCAFRRTHLIGDIEARSVELFFVDSKLSKIKVNFNDDFSDQLKEAVNSAFGSSTGHNQSGPMSQHHYYDKTYFWEADNIKLSYNYRSPSTNYMGDDFAGILYLEYSLNDYDDLQDKYRSKKYTPGDF